MDINYAELEPFIIEAKKSCYVGNGEKASPSRLASHDLSFQRGDWRYLDSYFGVTDFLGQEVVWYKDFPIWAMNYYGRILNDDVMNSSQSGEVIRESLSEMYKEGRFLGGFDYMMNGFVYRDQSKGTYKDFTGREAILKDGQEVYCLDYHGGLIRP